MINLSNAVNIKGFMFENELEWLARTAKKSKCIVEIGTYYGRSARTLADNMPEDAKLYCIDPYPGVVFYQNGVSAISSGSYVMRQAQKNLQEHIDSGRVTFHRGTVKDFPHFIKPDFIFIDGDHCEEAVRNDIDWAKRILFNGIISGHDYENIGWPCVKQVVDEHFPTIGREGFIWWTQK